MSDSIDLFQIGFTFRRWFRVFTIRWYAEKAAHPVYEPDGGFKDYRAWGKRDMGPGRFALEAWHLSLVFEKYATSRTTYGQLEAARDAYRRKHETQDR